MKNYLIQTLFLIAFGWSLQAQQSDPPALPQNETISITGVTAHVGNGTVVENATIVFENGKISEIGSNVAAKGRTIDAKGKHIYPGFISTNSSLGLVEISSVRATSDEDEVGNMTPNARSLVAFNAESRIVESMRPNGVLIAQVAPRGGRITGTSSIMQLDGWNWEDAAYKIDDAIHVNWPALYRRSRFGFGGGGGVEPNKDYEKQVQELQLFLEQAKAYNAGPKEVINLLYASTKGLFDGTQGLFINADDEKQMVDAINMATGLGIKKVVFIGGQEAHKISALLKQHNIAVLLSRPHRLPTATDQDVYLPYKLASILDKDGVLVGIENSGQMDRMNTRNLPFYAGTFAAYGLAKEKAVQLITQNAAKILGIDSTLGTLEVGKDATFFVSEGDALDMRTNKISHAFISGRELSLNTYQKDLYLRYKEKFDGQK
jgi:imidazolonepropionase-like amidohydrolase